MIRSLRKVLLIGPFLVPVPGMAQTSASDVRAIMTTAVQYLRDRQIRKLPAHVREHAGLRSDNLEPGLSGIERDQWLRGLAALAGASPIAARPCTGTALVPETGLNRAVCALEAVSYYVELEKPTVDGDSATIRIDGSWREAGSRTPVIWTSYCLRLVMREGQWRVTRTCGISST